MWYRSLTTKESSLKELDQKEKLTSAPSSSLSISYSVWIYINASIRFADLVKSHPTRSRWTVTRTLLESCQTYRTPKNFSASTNLKTCIQVKVWPRTRKWLAKSHRSFIHARQSINQKGEKTTDSMPRLALLKERLSWLAITLIIFSQPIKDGTQTSNKSIKTEWRKDKRLFFQWIKAALIQAIYRLSHRQSSRRSTTLKICLRQEAKGWLTAHRGPRQDKGKL